MMAELSAWHALPKDLVDGVTDGVTERTGGVPLFIEEVTRLLLERGEQGGTRAIPLTLQQSLTARLDRLGPAREVAQVASMIGRTFSYGSIAIARQCVFTQPRRKADIPAKQLIYVTAPVRCREEALLSRLWAGLPLRMERS